jgi:hypothetical protein
MNQVSKFYLKQAVYQVEIDGVEGAILVNYGGNSYETVGIEQSKVDGIATQLLAKKHGVNFAYKFSAKGETGMLK